MNFSSILLLASLILITDAKSFLDSDPQSVKSDTDASDMLMMLLERPGAADLSEAVRTQHAKDQHGKNQKELEAMFKSLPKNEQGNLAFPAARYALHRLFEQRHRWFVRGLHPKSNSGNDTESKTHMVSMVNAWQTVTAFDRKGVSLPALAALAGTLEELIQREVAGHLEGFYQTSSRSTEESVSAQTLRQLADSYLTIYISGASFTNNTKQNVKEDSDFMSANTKDWTETRQWVKSATREAQEQEDNCEGDVNKCSFTFNEAKRVVKTVVEKYGHFNDQQCHKLKGKLLQMEEKQTGRVKLADFYKAGLSGAWEFNEKIDYLRSLGALDESTQNDPKVIVPNYVSSWVNCLSSSELYSVCCRDDCEDYMQALEKHLAGPEGEVGQIISIVDSDATFRSHGEESRQRGASIAFSALRKRLESIADTNHGSIPIHGRLFAQWMHHAFPTTCPYPHEAGTTNPQTPDEWMTVTGHVDIKATDDEMQRILSEAQDRTKTTEKEDSAAEDELPWSDVEELLVVRPTQPPQRAMSFELVFLEASLVVAMVCAVIYVATSHREAKRQQQKAIV